MILRNLHFPRSQTPEFGNEENTVYERFFQGYSVKVADTHGIVSRTCLRVNPALTLGGIPPETFQYRLGNRSALEWVIDQHQVKEDKRSRIRSDPNRTDDEEYNPPLCRTTLSSADSRIWTTSRPGWYD